MSKKQIKTAQPVEFKAFQVWQRVPEAALIATFDVEPGENGKELAWDKACKMWQINPDHFTVKIV